MPRVPISITAFNIGSGSFIAGYAEHNQGGVFFAGNLWQFVMSRDTNKYGAYLLDPGSQTFSLVSDAGPDNPFYGPAFFWDGISNLAWFAYEDSLNATLLLQNFDMAAQAWSVPTTICPTATFGPNWVRSLHSRLDGSFITMAESWQVAGPGGGFYTSTTGVPHSDYSTNDPASPIECRPQAVTTDATGLTHLVYVDNTPGQNLYYQQISESDTLVDFASLGLGYTPDGLGGDVGLSTALLLNNGISDGILFGLTQNIAGVDRPIVIWISPLSNACAATVSASIDSVESAPAVFGYPPTLYQAAGKIYATWVDTLARVWLAETADPTFLTGWTSAVYYDPFGTPPLSPAPTGPRWSALTFSDTDALVGITMLYDDADPAIISRMYYIPFAVAAPPAVVPAMGSSGARFKPCTRHNDYQAAQLAEKVRIERAKRRDWPYRQLYPAELDITVNKLAQIVAPAANVLTAVLIYRVPHGFRFWMDAILQDGPEPFTPGDVSWTVDINAIVPNTAQAASVHGLINIPLPLGSTVTGEVWHFPMPYLFEPLTVVRSRIVNVNVPEGPPNYFTSGFFGFLVPVDRGH